MTFKLLGYNFDNRAMTDKQDSNDEIQSISRKFQSITTADAVVSSPVDTTRTCQALNRDFPSNPKMNNSTSSQSIPDGRKSLGVDDNSPVRNLPELNLPEKIVFVIDTTKEHDCTQFKLGNGAKYSPLFMIKRVVEIFISAKSKIQREHEFALMTLDTQSVHWLCNFTNNTKTILNYLDTLTEKNLDEAQKTFDLSKVFEMVYTKIPLLSGIDPKNPPQFVTRVILIYSRSHCIPKFQSSQNEFELLMEIPYFFLDSLLVHEPPSAENKCEEVYAELTALDVKNFSYILEAGRNATKLHDNMAKLLAHPLQRPVQKNASYTIGTLTTPQDLQTTV